MYMHSAEPIDRNASERHGKLASLLRRCPGWKLCSTPFPNNDDLLPRLLGISNRLQLHLLHSANRSRRKPAIFDLLCRLCELILDHDQECQQGLRLGLSGEGYESVWRLDSGNVANLKKLSIFKCTSDVVIIKTAYACVRPYWNF